MDQALAIFNAVTSFAIALLLSAAILSNKFEDGVVIKTGLILMVLGFTVTGWHLIDGLGCVDLTALNRARGMTHIGFIVAMAGYMGQARKGRSVADLIHFKMAKDILRKL